MQDPRSGEVIEKELYVTRKGATPAAEGQMGLIPGSMGQPAPGLHLGAPTSGSLPPMGFCGMYAG